MTANTRPSAAPSYHAPAAFVAGSESVFSIPRFEFESGETLADLRVGYVTHGVLNAARDNAILVPPGTGNTRHSADGYIGPGKAFDTRRYCVIAVDGIGAGASSRPGDGLRGRFPRYSVRDMVRAEHALVTEGLGISRLAAVAGASMGAFQALEWAIHFPHVPARVVLLVPAARAGNIMRSIVRSMIEVIQLDPLWRAGDYQAERARYLEAQSTLERALSLAQVAFGLLAMTGRSGFASGSWNSSAFRACDNFATTLLDDSLHHGIRLGMHR